MMSATLEAMASLVEARNTERAMQAAMRKAQQAAAQQGAQQGGQQGGQQGAQGAQGAQAGQGAQQPSGADATQNAQRANQRLSPQELGNQFRQNHQAGQNWGGFAGEGARGSIGQAGEAGAEKAALYQKLLDDKNVKDAGAGKKVDFTESSATRNNDATRNALDPTRATRDTGAPAAQDAVHRGRRGARAANNRPATNAGNTANDVATQNNRPADSARGAGTTRNIRGFREVDEQKLKDALPNNAKHLAKSFIEAGRKHNIDPIALAGISGHETGNWTSSAFKNKNNAMGISNRNGPIRMSSAEASIDRMAQGLANPKGYYKNANTVAEIGRIYAPIGANNDPRGLNNHWTRGVSARIDRLERSVMN